MDSAPLEEAIGGNRRTLEEKLDLARWGNIVNYEILLNLVAVADPALYAHEYALWAHEGRIFRRSAKSEEVRIFSYSVRQAFKPGMEMALERTREKLVESEKLLTLHKILSAWRATALEGCGEKLQAAQGLLEVQMELCELREVADAAQSDVSFEQVTPMGLCQSYWVHNPLKRAPVRYELGERVAGGANKAVVGMLWSAAAKVMARNYNLACPCARLEAGGEIC